MGLAALAAEWSGVAFLTGRSSGLEKRRGATGAADADSLGLCGRRDKQDVEPRKMPRLGPGEAKAAWRWRSETEPSAARRSEASSKARLLEGRNTEAGWVLIKTEVPTVLADTSFLGLCERKPHYVR